MQNPGNIAHSWSSYLVVALHEFLGLVTLQLGEDDLVKDALADLLVGESNIG